MTDIRMIWDGTQGDLAIDGADLARDDTLETAIVISLMTDALVDPDELPEGETDRRGYWGQAVQPDPDDNFGSKLWLLDRTKRTPDILPRAEEYCVEALTWLVADGRAIAVDASAQFNNNILAITIAITLPDFREREFQFAVQ